MESEPIVGTFTQMSGYRFGAGLFDIVLHARCIGLRKSADPRLPVLRVF